MYTVVQAVITFTDPRVAPFTLWAVTEPLRGSVVFWARSLEEAATAAAERNS